MSISNAPGPAIKHGCARLRLCVVAALAFIACGCSTMAPVTSDRSLEASQSDHANFHARHPTRSALLGFFASWEGTPYNFGGTSRHGIDCSAFVLRAFQELFAIELPRTTFEQVTQGATVKRPDLVHGDLVFFKTAPAARHVGIYIGDGEFIHASSSRGVTRSYIGSTYWTPRYWTAIRVL